eukprot:g19619.t1
MYTGDASRSVRRRFVPEKLSMKKGVPLAVSKAAAIISAYIASGIGLLPQTLLQHATMVRGRPQICPIPGESEKMPKAMQPKSLERMRKAWRTSLDLRQNVKAYLGDHNYTDNGRNWYNVDKLQAVLENFKQRQYAEIIEKHKKKWEVRKLEWVDHKRRYKRFKGFLQCRYINPDACRYPLRY